MRRFRCPRNHEEIMAKRRRCGEREADRARERYNKGVLIKKQARRNKNPCANV